jgi:NAD-dependent dihydropyrimidine dehydrogenase PreA subunit
MQQTAEERGIECVVSSIDNADPAAELTASEETLVGLVNPTHGFMVPWNMLKFAFKMPRKRRARAFCVAARAGWFIGPRQVPGIAGLAAFIPALILRLKGYKIRGVMSINMPTNWLALHWGMKDKNNEKVFTRSHPRVCDFMTKILDGKKHWATLNNLWELLWSILLWWIALLYICFGRFFLAKLFFADARCDGCGICRNFCSVGGVTVSAKTGSRPYWKIYCETCMRCMAYCPKQAIQASWPWAAFLIWITGSPWFALWIRRLIPGLSGVLNGWVEMLVTMLITLAVICLFYLFFHVLGRIRFINAFFRYTTPTSYWRRYHAPGVKLTDLTAPRKAGGKKNTHDRTG